MSQLCYIHERTISSEMGMNPTTTNITIVALEEEP